jgi:hypothetical protein
MEMNDVEIEDTPVVSPRVSQQNDAETDSKIDELLFDDDKYYWSEKEFEDDHSSEFDLDTDSEQSDPSFRHKVKEFVGDVDSRHWQIKSLLEILRNETGHIELPRFASTLIDLRFKVVTRKVDPGDYCHFGIRNSISQMDYKFLKTANEIKIDICIDGVPFVKSAKLSMWSILGEEY